ncbi:carbohydrate-binding family 9-like protein [uncultured Draconibacterium sp.]|uniref:carbohydrate-binding family 9-like protein n=1 Tax=uncultured Draconibacterium sp. TaxID=1573823 RepID=UPI0032600DB7
MRGIRSVFFFTLFLIGVFKQTAHAQWGNYAHLFSLPNTYTAPYCQGNILIDGVADEQAWNQAPWTTEFVDIEGNHKPEPAYKTQVKMLWDEDNLYIFAQLEEEHIWAYYSKNDMIVYHENDFEVFIDPDGSTHNYYEFEVNAQNTLFDLFLPKPYRNGGQPDIKWNTRGFKSAIYIDGSLNNPNDKDKKWCIEMAIPFSALNYNGTYAQPEAGDSWKINFSRVQWQTDIIDGKYLRKTDDTGKLIPENNWVWSPQGVINMHYPERWGLIQFAASNTEAGISGFPIPEKELLTRRLWHIYYAQRDYHKKNNTFCNDLATLNVAAQGNEKSTSFTIDLRASEKTWTAKLTTSKELVISINQDGLTEELSGK